MSIDFPIISVVTPSYNQGPFLEETILSILNQKYEKLEYVIIDGGSTDASMEIIRKYQDQLTYWLSEPDQGQYDAINKGFSKTTGEIMAWLNSDDKYTPWAFSVIAEIFRTHPEVEWLTTLYSMIWDERGRATGCSYTGGFNSRSFWRGANLCGRGWYSRAMIQQESTFWRRSLWERAGGRVDDSLEYAGDFELWARFFKHAELYAVATPLAGFRKHKNQKTSTAMERYQMEAETVLRLYGKKPYGKIESLIRKGLWPGFAHRPLKKIPPFLTALLCKLNFLEPVKLCTWTGTEWEVNTCYTL